MKKKTHGELLTEFDCLIFSAIRNCINFQEYRIAFDLADTFHFFSRVLIKNELDFDHFSIERIEKYKKWKNLVTRDYIKRIIKKFKEIKRTFKQLNNRRFKK